MRRRSSLPYRPARSWVPQGLGNGFALPHARIEGLDRLFGMFARLHRPVHFDSIDGNPVDLVFLLLIPPAAGSEHLAALASISRNLRDKEFTARLRKAPSAAALRSPAFVIFKRLSYNPTPPPPPPNHSLACAETGAAISYLTFTPQPSGEAISLSIST